MRIEYASYIVAVICFLFAGIVFATYPTYIADTIIVATLIVVLAILGLLLIGIGYSQRQKETVTLPAASTTSKSPEEPKMQKEKPNKKTSRKQRKS